jgi:integrase
MSVTPDTEQTALPTGLFRRENGRFSIRVMIPTDLLEHYGKDRIVRALGTTNQAEAKRAGAKVTVALQDEFEAVRKGLNGNAPQLEPTYDPDAVAAKMLQTLRTKRAAAVASGSLDQFNALIRDQLADHQAVLDGNEEPSWSLERHEGIRNGLRAMLTGDGAIAIAAVQTAKVAPQADGDDPSLTELVALWTKHQTRPTATVKSMNRVVERFESVVGSRTVKAVTRRDLASFIDKMRTPGAVTPEGFSIPNMNSMLSLLSALFGFAVKRHLIEANPAANTQIPDTRRPREKRREFDAAALKAIFDSPVYSQGERPKREAGEAAYWVPLLALYTGARIGELCQLHPENVTEEGYTDPEGNAHTAWVITFEADKSRGQRVKTEGTERRIPVHPDLIELGFLKYLAQVRGQSRLFPDIKGFDPERISDAWGQWFSDYLRDVCGVTDKRMTFHSFRHSFKHYGRQALIPADVHNALTGHETGDAADAYGGLSFPLHPLVEGMNRYRVPSFKLPASPAGLKS